MKVRHQTQYRPFSITIGLGANYEGHPPECGIGLSDNNVQRIIERSEVGAVIDQWLAERATAGKLCLRGELGCVHKRFIELPPSQHASDGKTFKEHVISYSGALEPGQGASTTDMLEALNDLVQFVAKELQRPRVRVRYCGELTTYEVVPEEAPVVGMEY